MNKDVLELVAKSLFQLICIPFWVLAALLTIRYDQSIQ